jgi:hypothetical protein
VGGIQERIQACKVRACKAQVCIRVCRVPACTPACKVPACKAQVCIRACRVPVCIRACRVLACIRVCRVPVCIRACRVPACIQVCKAWEDIQDTWLLLQNKRLLESSGKLPERMDTFISDFGSKSSVRIGLVGNGLFSTIGKNNVIRAGHYFAVTGFGTSIIIVFVFNGISKAVRFLRGLFKKIHLV